MAVENGEWIMYGVEEDDPYCIHTPEQLLELINEIGFLPLFKNEIPGFSVEERTVPEHLWGYDHIAAGYREDPARSKERIYQHIRDRYPIASEKQIKKVFK